MQDQRWQLVATYQDSSGKVIDRMYCWPPFDTREKGMEVLEVQQAKLPTEPNEHGLIISVSCEPVGGDPGTAPVGATLH